MRRFDFVDSLRGIAALYIVSFHTMLVPNPHLAVPDHVALIVKNGIRYYACLGGLARRKHAFPGQSALPAVKSPTAGATGPCAGDDTE